MLPRDRCSIRKRKKGFYTFPNHPVDPGAHLAFCVTGKRGLCLGVKLTLTLHVIPRLNLRKDVPPLLSKHLHVMMRSKARG